jgi:transcriptional regulator with XRE-family HTH domain
MYPNLKLKLWKTGIRQNRLAQMLHVDATMISKVINGFREPSADLRIRIATVLKCDEVWLFERADEFGDAFEYSSKSVPASDSRPAADRQPSKKEQV